MAGVIMRKIVFAVFCAVFAGAWQSSGPGPLAGNSGPARFDSSLAAFINKSGTTTIKGHAFLRKKNGYTVDASGEIVRLIPVTPYADERFRKIYGNRKFVPTILAPRLEPADPGYDTFSRQTKADALGKFEFQNVGPGHYYVATQLVFVDTSKYFNDGGAIYDEVIVTGKETDPIKLILSGN